MSNSHPAIRVEQLSKRYRLGPRERYATLRDRVSALARAPWDLWRRDSGPIVWALQDVSFEVAQGSLVGVIGLNGAGKSTLLKVLARITPPTSGCAVVRGRVGSLLEVGTGFHPELTGRENVHLSGAMLGMRRAEIARKFDEIVDFAGVDQFIDTPLKQYSSGMAVRLGFAVAAHLETDILIVDEALAVGDVAFQQKCLGRMAGVARDGRTVLFVSHDLSAIRTLTERTICLEAGKVAAYGCTPEVVQEYATRHSTITTQDGYVALGGRARHEMHHEPEHVRFDWVRTRDVDGAQRAAFGEGQPIVVEFGFTVLEPVSHLEFGIGVSSLRHGVELFVVMSPTYEGPIAPGTHVLGMRIDPNHLKVGAYSMGLKLFANGMRVDTLHDALRFGVVEAGAARTAGRYRRLGGHLNFDYAWGRIDRRPVGVS